MIKYNIFNKKSHNMAEYDHVKNSLHFVDCLGNK